ncbi:MAG: hypothetical protein JWP97_2408 [Labilithrix sp.]|nr:hypothetical protein [Labilithrix sp.]
MRRSATWGRGARRATAAALLLVGVARSSTARASSAEELVREARAHETAREDDLAIRRYMEALSLDPTEEDGYLGLGRLRARHGDLREAERVYSVALEHVPASRAARLERAHVRRALGFRADAESDLLARGDEDVASLRVLASWYGEDGLVPAQLAIWRRIAARAEASADPVLLHEARAQVRALLVVVGPADPAASPAADHGLRALVASLARRGS